eukprot:XP_013976171.1 chromodomain-helicase-DNA-binding protein 1-like isoform X7 [Canis lupus familiaris]
MERAGAGRSGGDMPGFLLAVQSRSRGEAARTRVEEQDLQQWGLTGIRLRSYQLEGVNWLARCFHCQNGCILGDEMGLGKTCQTIALFIYLAGRLNDEGPFLILCPLSVLSNWTEEMERFAPGLSCVMYAGDKEERARLQQDLKQESRFHVLLTTYEICLKDSSFLKSGHRVLLFSQMTQMLDILQDYMDYRGYSYERVDGSVRGEERHLAIKNFGQQPVFVFLLSTRAGGVGMNLTAADTVIFVDSDFNPQNDLQAAARAHRIGQNKSVKVIRLIGRDTVEEIVYRKAASKLQLTNAIIEGGHFTLGAQKPAADADLQLSEILKFGLDKLLSSQGSTMDEIDLERILGETKNGQWISDALATTEGGVREQEEGKNHMYLFEGKDYSKEPSKEDRESFEQLVNLQKTFLEKTTQEGRLLRNKGNVLLPGLSEESTKRKRILSPEELEDRRKKRQEAAAKRKRLMEEKKRKKEKVEHEKKMVWWESNNYQSFCLPSEESEPEDLEDQEDESSAQLDYEDPDSTAIKYVRGDVTHPQAGAEDAVIVHCVDDSGRWGRGGLFTALETRSAEPRRIYELAGKMKDLNLGGVLLFPVDDKESRNKGQDLLALIVAQHRDRSNVLSGIKMAALEEGLKKIYLAAKKKKASVHLPRIGHATKAFNWYGTERLIRKHLAAKGIPTYIYYFPRSRVAVLHPQSSSSPRQLMP